MSRPPAVLFVCLGNICRSPLAEAALRLEAERLSVKVEIDSAGTGDYHIGAAPDRRAQAVALRHGADISHLKARQVSEADFRRFDHVIALDHENLHILKRLRPDDATASLSLLLDHVTGRVGEPVADPYYGNADGFETTWSDVSAGAKALMVRLIASNTREPAD
ncbi:protein-tyrosine phosphatase [Fulvimarina manganoxydans]|uniref:protein-tyrosine-phosphatase n=1 Tax=Fulvimarina manganoxydans TaxID=937218 RepID=A0A1W2CRE7_9HYPH|nr:low molecular weight protein-tyrosine-phosphatase [Fulvimarina manganoxydans]SMC87781.1 protein-tyrosine phosphatase [Fulvimarina manganoxydans]